MLRAKKEAFSKCVISHYTFGCGRTVRETVNFFKTQGKAPTTVRGIISRYVATGSTNYKKIPGRPAKETAPGKLEKVKALFQKAPSTSLSVAAKKLKMNRSTLVLAKVHKLGIKSYVKKKAPKYIKNQEQRAKSGCRFVYKKNLRKVLIIDDETYVPWEPSDVSTKEYYHAADPAEVSYAEKVKPKAKFFKKILIWQAIDEFGNISDAFVSEGTLNSKVYLEECIRARLIPFIQAHHEMNEVLFWPDLATSHYARDVTEYLQSQCLEVVPKEKNPPNVPNARGIEKFWALCKREYSTRQKPPVSLRGFKQVWRNISQKVARESGKAVMNHGCRLMREIGYRGIEGQNKK